MVHRERHAYLGFFRKSWLVPLTLVAFLLLDRFLVLKSFLLKITDDDQAVLAYAVQDYLHFKFREPHFYGQAYGNTFESFLAALFFWGAIPPHAALSVVTTALAVFPFLLFFGLAWEKGAWRSALTILALPLLMTSEYAMISSMPRGLMPGIFLGSVAFFLAYRAPKGAVTLVLCGMFFALGVAFNTGSALLIVPALLFIVAKRFNERKSVVLLVGGLASGYLCYLSAQSFYSRSSAYNLHPSPVFEFHWALILRGFASRSRFFSFFSPYFFPSAEVFLAFFLLLALALICFYRTPVRIAAITGLGILVGSLGVAKIHDATPSLFFHWSRMFLAAPVLLALFLLWLAVEPHRFSICLRKSEDSKAKWAWALVMIALFLGKPWTLAVLSARTLAEKEHSPVSTIKTEKVKELCAEYGELAERNGAELIVFLESRAQAYACGAFLYGKVGTLYPAYDRRTWAMLEESHESRSRILIVGAGPSFCRHLPGTATECAYLGSKNDVVSLRPGQPVVPLLRSMGYSIRHL